MDNALYVALSRQMILRRQMDVVANNIANSDTAGFKVEQVMINTDPVDIAQTQDGSTQVNYVIDPGVARNFAQGSLSRTSSPLDVAIEGDGFFKVQTERGERFTRDGRFATDAQGRLVTKAGDAVLGDGGEEIMVDTAKGELGISRDGIVSQDGQRLGKIGVYRFESMAGLSKEGDSLYVNEGNIPGIAAPDAIVHQSMVESSNVQSIIEITNMIEITRTYERISKIMDQLSQLDRSAVERLGKVSA